MRALVDVVRGALMGLAEVVPGVSGGTIALIVGVYYILIDSAAHGVRMLIAPLRGQGWTGVVAEARQVRWDVAIPVAVGMLSAILVGAALLEPLIEEYPVQVRAVFFGLVLAGLSVPARMVGVWVPRDLLVVLPAVVVAFILTGLPPSSVSDPSPGLVFISGAIAVCALALPGVSGSFILLSMGMYEITLSAVNDRDWAYLAVFSMGAAAGLGTFVMILQWLLEHRTKPTLLVLTGLMIGSLRALWPWQTSERELLAPESGQLLMAIGLTLTGMALVGVLLWGERRLGRYLHDPELANPRSGSV